MQNYKIYHADQYRDSGIDYVKAGRVAMMDFLFTGFFEKKSALFTSNPIFLKLKFLQKIGFVKNLQVDEIEKIEWFKNLEPEEAVKIIPNYFVAEFQQKYGDVKIEKMIEELDGYKKDRFLQKKILTGDMGGILKHN